MSSVEAILLVVAIGAGAFAQSASGFGFSLVAAPVSGIVLGAADGIRLAVALAVVIDVLVLTRDRGSVDRHSLARLLIPGLIAAVPAYFVTQVVDGPVLLTIAGGVTLLTVLILGWSEVPRPARKGRHDPDMDMLCPQPNWVLAGFAAGTMGITAGLAGPPVALTALRTGRPVVDSRATLAAFFVAIDLTATATRGLPPANMLLLTLLTALVGGYLMGVQFGCRLPDKVLRFVVLLLAGGAGFSALVS